MRVKMLYIVFFLIIFLLCSCRLNETMEAKENDIQLFKESEEIALLYQEIIEEQLCNKQTISRDVMKKVLKILEEGGYSAIDVENQVDMVNSQQVKEFCKKVDEKQDGKLTIFAISYNGGFNRYDFSTKEGQVAVTRSWLSWENNKPKSKNKERYVAYSWVYTENGYLFFEQYHPDGFDGPSGHTAIRVKSLDETCRELNQKYISSIGYNLNNMFLTNWSEKDFKDLNFYDAYDVFYRMETGNQVPFEDNYMTTVYEIPKIEFEKVVLKYFKIDNRVLEQKLDYNEKNKTYEYRPRSFYDCSITPNIPYSEVVSYEKNEDGTLQLFVNAVWPEQNLECAFSHKVTIRIMNDGRVQYVSNHIIPSKNNVKPTWHQDRLTKKEWQSILEENVG